MSFWATAIVAANRAVAAPTTAITSAAYDDDALSTGLMRHIRNTPAVTIVAAWISADTGVGPSIASGSHRYSGSCALLPHGTDEQQTARWPWRSLAPWLACCVVDADVAQRALAWKAKNIAIMKPQSPTRLVTNAFLPAVAALSRVVPERDQQVRARADALPPEERDEHVLAEHQHQHAEREQVEVQEELGELRVAVHVADRVEVDQRADAGDEQAHRDAQRIGEEREVDVQTSRRAPRRTPWRRAARSSAIFDEQVEEHADRDDERAAAHQRRQVAGLRIAEPAPEQQDQHEPGERQRRDQPDDVEHRLSPSTPRGRRRWRWAGGAGSATMMPRPTTTSAAATTSTKNTVVCPPMSPSCLLSATKLRLTALSISSTHMNMTSGLRRTSTPTVPIANSTAASTRYHVVVGERQRRSLIGVSGEAFGGAARQQHGADDGDDQQHRRELEGEHVVAEQVAASLRMLLSWSRRRRP